MRASSLSRCCWGKNGVEERKSIGKLSAFEQNALEGMLDTLKKRYRPGRRVR
ncbi:malate dehydrogenase [Citrobacter koseri]|uniref:Malate dehydrogenase n=1 Tax=Citrobacter koseri TaxID=545 RepID=A0A2X2WA88_CITKO|nr:malate dehydrogenase [Citrobacter koseri]